VIIENVVVNPKLENSLFTKPDRSPESKVRANEQRHAKTCFSPVGSV
jgi:hypothetical protein